MLRYQLGISDIDYDRTLGTGLVGYRYPSANLLYTATMSPRLDLTLTANAARLEVPLTRAETDTRGAQAGFRFRVTERFDLEARTGRTKRRRADAVTSRKAISLPPPGTTTRSILELTLSQDVEPSGNGILVHAENLRLAYSFKLTERLTLAANVRASLREDTEVDLRQYDYAMAAHCWRCRGHSTRAGRSVSPAATCARNTNFSTATPMGVAWA